MDIPSETRGDGLRKGAQELKDLDVDRVDGVDKPATGRNFLLFKAEDGDAIMKGYGMLATVAHEVLAKARADTNLVVSRKSAIALNGLAQVLGEDAVFVGKSVPTQPYEFSEPDVNRRGPADEDLGPNFTPRSMPGSMVGSVQFSLKDEAGGDLKAKAWPPAEEKPKDGEPDEDDVPKKKAWPPAEEKPKKPEDTPMARSIEAMAKAIQAQTDSINKVLGITKVMKDEGEPRQADRRPRSRQVEDDEPVQVRKSGGGYEPRFGVSFSDIAFGAR